MSADISLGSVDLPPRRVEAAGPGPEATALRRAYLDLLKLSLCDLAGASTHTISWTGDRRVFVRELAENDEQMGWRIAGRDWPSNALTMVGLRRLDDVQRCIESVVSDGVEGDVIEAGSWRGGTSMLMRATLNSLGAVDRTVWVADSFQGFPAPESDGVDEDRELEADMGPLAYLAPSLEQVRSHFARFGLDRGVDFVPGFFEETMDQVRGRQWSVIRLDADTYKATKLTLEALYPTLSVGGYLISDDYGFLPACRRAIDEFRSEHGITEPIEPVDFNGIRWRRERSDPALTAAASASASASASPAVKPRAGSAPTITRIPTDHELELQDEVTALRQQVRGLNERLAELSGSPLARPAAWRRRRRHDR